MKHTLFDSEAWLTCETRDYIDEFLDCTDQTRENFTSEEQLHDATRDWLADNVEHEWRDFLLTAGRVKGTCVVTGYFMSWMGPQQGGKVYPSLSDAISGIIMDDSHPIFSIDEKGLVTLEETHHDTPCSGNHYEFRILSAAGEKYYTRHKNDDPRSLCETLATKKYTRQIPLKAFYLSKTDFKERDTK